MVAANTPQAIIVRMTARPRKPNASLFGKGLRSPNLHDIKYHHAEKTNEKSAPPSSAHVSASLKCMASPIWRPWHSTMPRTACHRRAAAYNDRMTRPDFLIVGGGVIGLTTAWHLAAEGARVAVAE